MSKSGSNSLFTDDDFAGAEGSPWDMPTPRKQQSRADVVRNLLPPSDVPDAYIETFDTVVREDGNAERVNAGGIAKLFAAARLGADQQAQIMSMVVPAAGGDIAVGRGEFNVLLALIALAQENETISLDTVDERRRSTSAPVSPSHLPFSRKLSHFPMTILGPCSPSYRLSTYQCAICGVRC